MAMTGGRNVAAALMASALFLGWGSVLAQDDQVAVVPAVTNVATFLVQITNSTSFALMPTNAIVNLEAPLYTNAEDIAAAAISTNVAALLPSVHRIPVAVPAVAPVAAPPVTNLVSDVQALRKVLSNSNTNTTEGVLGVVSPEQDAIFTDVYFSAATNLPPAAMSGVSITNLVKSTVDSQIKQAAQDAVIAAVNSVNAAADKVAATETRRRIATRTFKLQHASAEDVAERFNTMWNGDFGIGWKVTKIAQPFSEANVVMVTAPGAILEACEQAIKAIDVESRQVYIEARFVELENSAVHKLGIDWSMLNEMGGTASFGGGIDKRNIGNAVQNFARNVTTSGDSVNYSIASGTKSKTESTSKTHNADGTSTSTESQSTTSTSTGRDGGVEYFTGTLSFTDMSLVLSALDTASDAKIFSNPKIIVTSGKKASVDMTEKYPNVAINAKRTLNGNSESLDLDMKMMQIPGEDKLMFAKEAFFSWGISLEVTPRVTTNDLINVSIVPTISEKAGEVTAGSGSMSQGSRYPIISVQRLVTDFSLRAGTTAVIGGLSKTTEEQVDSGIPWLRDIPWIGDKLFGRKTRQKKQKEIIVFVTVGLADPKALTPEVGLPKNAVLGRMYTQGQKLEPGDRTGNAIEGIASLDTRSLDEQARDPLATNTVEKTTFRLPFTNPMSFGNNGADKKDGNNEKKEESK